MKIISFSVWGKKQMYIQGTLKNLELQKKYYPEWICRFYIDETFPEDIRQTLEDGGAQLYEMPKSDGNYGLFWRFEPLKDDTIERFIVRDVDSRLNPREADAVKDWEESGYRFHIMRDHPQHKVPICGGLWGATIDFINEVKYDYDEILMRYLNGLSFQELYKQRGKYFNCDQPFLWKWIWPKIINSHLAHLTNDDLRFVKASWTTLTYDDGPERLFRVELPNGGFVGQPFNENDIEIK